MSLDAKRLLALLVALTVLAGGCRSASTDTTGNSTDSARAEAATPENITPDDPAGQDPSPQDPATQDPAPEADAPRVVPPLELPAAAPGSDAAAAALLQGLERFVTTAELSAGVPWPDLRNPDPVAAYRSDAAFQNWMSANNPTPSLVSAYTAPGSPERDFDLELFGLRNSFDLRSGPATPPYSMRIEGLVHPAATGITDALLAQVPEGSAAVVYWDSMGPSDTFTADGQFWGTNNGWTEVGPWVAIMAPTAVGWQVWWDELTEPPPPGSREQRGSPEDEIPRRDV